MRGRAWWVWRKAAGSATGRGLAAATLMGNGVAYFLLDAGLGRRTTSYLLQERIMSLWIYGALLLGAGLWLAATRTRRREPVGRAAAVAALSVAALLLVPYLLAGALTVMGWIGPLIYALWVEAAFIDDDIGT